MARKAQTFLITLLAANAAAASLHAEKRALLIGIGAYNRDAQLQELEGPPSDLDSMRDLLGKKLGFTDITELRGSQATRAAILNSLNQLRARVRPGDYVVFYYGGHGTSYGDPGAHTWGLDPNTGALLPYDIRLGEGPQVLAQLIVGKRDLRPVFAEIDKVATLFAIFDTCYSADAAKSAAQPARSRYVPLASLTRGGGSTPKAGDLDADTATMAQHQDTTPFPYQRLISLAAAGKFQQAEDIRPEESFDKRAHGRLTESLLRGMRGDADKDHDGRISHDELYTYLQESAVRWRHQPVMQAGAAASLGSSVFDLAAAATGRPNPAPESNQSPAGKVIVKTEGIDAALVARIARLPRVAVWPGSGSFDLLVQRGPAGFDLYDSSQVAVSNDSLPAQDLLNRIAAQPQVRDLLATSYTQQFNIALRMKPDDQSAWFGGQKLNFSARTDRRAFLLLLNIDVTGAVTVVYPFQHAAVAADPGIFAVLGIPDTVTRPFGVEYMKLFAFTSKPADFDHWIVPPNEETAKTVDPGTPEFERLMRMLQSSKEGRAETALRLVTVPLPDKP